ncbi:MAG: hypothetical protein H8E20_14605 [Verrucomicrobia bacterium]|nr:hypothetical protein [Verrucomicrobiota bacterium]
MIQEQTDPRVVSVALVNDPTQDLTGDINKNSQSECSFVLGENSTIIAAYWDTHHSIYGLGGYDEFTSNGIFVQSTGYSISNNGGESFTDKETLLQRKAENIHEGDAGDPVMARNTIQGHPNYGQIYLATIPSREEWKGLRFWEFDSDAKRFNLKSTDITNGDISEADKPMIAVNNFIDEDGSYFSNSGHVYISFTAYSTTLNDGAVHLTHYDGKDGAWNKTVIGKGHGSSIAILPDGQVFVFYVTREDETNFLKYNEFYEGMEIPNTIPTIPAHSTENMSLYSTDYNGSANLLRQNDSPEDDNFKTNAFPRTTVNPNNGSIYLVFADHPSRTIEEGMQDKSDIYIMEGVRISSNEIDWKQSIRVNDDNTDTDQWLPDISISPSGNKLFVGYYSRQDSSNNSSIKAYGAIADISNGLTSNSFESFPLSTSFPPLFAGAVTINPPENLWNFDHVWPQRNVRIDIINGIATGPAIETDHLEPDYPDYIDTNKNYVDFCADDYTWADADDTYFYFAWCDRSFSSGINGKCRPDANAKLAKIKY